jgi:uncharacterized protein (DUF488 family)
MTPLAVFTIGHSTHDADAFVALLRRHGVNALADVRSSPYSRFNPQFNRETLQQDLQANGIAYVFLGEELGARSEDPDCYENGKVQFDRLAQTPLFQSGIERVLEGAKRYRPAMMCAEKDPLECHRTILVARTLIERGVDVRHILEDGSIESHDRALDRLLTQFKLDEPDLFRTREESIADAYRLQAGRIAYSENQAADEDRALLAETPIPPPGSKASGP